MKYLLIVLVLLTAGCRTYTQAEWDAGRVYRDQKGSELVCRHKVAIVAKSMIHRSEKFDLVYGITLNGNRHVWIEQYLDGEVYLVEPTWGYDPTHRFTEVGRVPYPEQAATVIVAVNGWLREAKLQPIGI